VPELEVGEMIILIISMFSITFTLFVIRARKDILKWVPGYICLFITFISTNVEALVAPDTFNFLEHFCIMLSGICFASAFIHEFYITVMKGKINPIAQTKKVMSE
jgi:hypothetical protein